MSSPLDRYREVSSRVSAAAGGREVCLIAVSKGQSIDAIEELYEFGHRDFGENYAQELIEKARAIGERGLSGLRWHFIGHLQSNKSKSIVPVVSSVHSVDSAGLANELNKRWLAAGRDGKLPVFLEVNIDGEASKAGVLPDAAAALAQQVARCEALDLRGLMCVPAHESVGGFDRLRALELQCRPHTKGALSMGMSGDFEQALRAGATHVRVGTALFGARPPRLS